ncbi:MAG: integration host factor subunit beta [Victivallaceae bacterium]|nr:integration host factor subunit beta [Victivallaceae bacterium]MDD4317462.1 integration host factor subunit beta [Victivallaceae bacterium]MDD5662921.1 integration host factor subunit beta [Victivallaceae bacterium]
MYRSTRRKTMTKRDLVLRISKESGLVQNDVAEIVQKTLDYIADDLAAGSTIELRNFGVFEVRVRKSRKGRNPNRPKNEVVIPERVVVRFRAGKELKERVEKLNPSKIV